MATIVAIAAVAAIVVVTIVAIVALCFIFLVFSTKRQRRGRMDGESVTNDSNHDTTGIEVAGIEGGRSRSRKT